MTTFVIPVWSWKQILQFKELDFVDNIHISVSWNKAGYFATINPNIQNEVIYSSIKCLYV